MLPITHKIKPLYAIIVNHGRPHGVGMSRVCARHPCQNFKKSFDTGEVLLFMKGLFHYWREGSLHS